MRRNNVVNRRKTQLRRGYDGRRHDGHAGAKVDDGHAGLESEGHGHQETQSAAAGRANIWKITNITSCQHHVQFFPRSFW